MKVTVALALVLALVRVQVALAAFCGGVMPPTGGPSFYVATTGSDSNAGTLAAPFKTLTKCQAAMEGQPTGGTKTCTVRAGTYSLGATLAFGASDNGETWQYYAPDGVNSADVDGGGTVDVIEWGANNLIWNGIKVSNCFNYCFHHDDGTNVTNGEIENSDIGTNHAVTENSFPGLVHINGFNGFKVFNNYFHDALSQCTAFFAFSGSEIAEGLDIENNVYLRCVQQVNDGGAIYQEFFDNYTATSCVIKNNFVRDQGVAGMNDVHDVYFDEGTNHCTVSGNYLGPASTGNPGASTGAFLNDGHQNVVTGNIIDLGLANNRWSGVWWSPGGQGFTTAGNTMSNNIIVMNFSGSLATNAFGVSGQAYVQINQSPEPSISSNAYHQYGSGSLVTTGNATSDSSPQTYSPTQLGLTFTGCVPAQSGTATVNGAPVNFPSGFPTSWGPPGFTIPSSTNCS